MASIHSSSDAAVFSARASLLKTMEAAPPDTSSTKSTPSPNTTQALPAFIYLVGVDGRLMWYRHNGASSGAGLETPGAWSGGLPGGRGWNGLKAVFGGGGNTIYGIGEDGLLKW